MTKLPPDIPRANFTIPDNARRGIGVLRRAFNAHQPTDPAAVLCIGWGHLALNSGHRSENVAFSFYGQSQLVGVSAAIQKVSGIDVVFFASPEDYPKLSGRILDFHDDRGFFMSRPER